MVSRGVRLVIAVSRVAGITRDNLASRTLITLSRGGRFAADVMLVESDAGRAVVKDFASRGLLVRHSLGRWLIRREVRIHRVLQGHPAVPTLLGRIDRFAFATLHCDGSRFSFRRPWIFDAEFARRLARAVDGLHARGVVHLDLAHRSNVRADTAGRPVIVDFETALRFRPGGLAARVALPLLARIDRHQIRKWVPSAVQSDVAASSPAGASRGDRGASRPT
jgi:hypothetical protein